MTQFKSTVDLQTALLTYLFSLTGCLPCTLSLSDMFKDSPLLFLFLFSCILPADNAQWFRLEHNGWLLSGKWGFIFQSLSRQQKQRFESHRVFKRRGRGGRLLIKVVSCFFFLCVSLVLPHSVSIYFLHFSGVQSITLSPQYAVIPFQIILKTSQVGWPAPLNLTESHAVYNDEDDESLLPGIVAKVTLHWNSQTKWIFFGRDNRHLLFLRMKMGIFSWPWKPPRKICSLPV